MNNFKDIIIYVGNKGTDEQNLIIDNIFHTCLSEGAKFTNIDTEIGTYLHIATQTEGELDISNLKDSEVAGFIMKPLINEGKVNGNIAVYIFTRNSHPRYITKVYNEEGQFVKYSLSILDDIDLSMTEGTMINIGMDILRSTNYNIEAKNEEVFSINNDDILVTVYKEVKGNTPSIDFGLIKPLLLIRKWDIDVINIILNNIEKEVEFRNDNIIYNNRACTNFYGKDAQLGVFPFGQVLPVINSYNVTFIIEIKDKHSDKEVRKVYSLNTGGSYGFNQN